MQGPRAPNSLYYMQRSHPSRHSLFSLQIPLLNILLVTLHLIAHLKLRPVLKPHPAFAALAHFVDVFFDVFERGERS